MSTCQPTHGTLHPAKPLLTLSRFLFALTASWATLPPAANAQLTVLGTQYRADQPFPAYECFWRDSQYPNCNASSPMGASLHVFLRNDGGAALTISDATLSGMSLTQSLVVQQQVVKRHPASIYFATLTSTELQTLLNAGEPVWWKADPPVIAPGETTQVVIRLRQTPTLTTIPVTVVHSGGTVPVSIAVASSPPRIISASFSADLTRVFLYWRRSGAGAAPTVIKMDGQDVTALCTTRSDPLLNTSVTTLQLPAPPAAGSYHVFQGVYADGQTATAGSRTWTNEFIYGMWGAWPGSDGDTTVAQTYINDITNHNINTQVQTLGSPAVQGYIKTSAGQQYCADRGLGFVVDEIGKWGVFSPRHWFIRDEPDAADSLVTGLPSNKMVGSLALSCVQEGHGLRAGNPAVPTSLNLDMTYKPYNWYNYGQVADVMMSDPYYQARLREAYNNPSRIPLYSKATYVYAVSEIAQASAEPNPLHIVLYACEYVASSGSSFPFPTPESKRIEVYYALAGGAKGLSYWWYIPGSPSNGVGDGPKNGDAAANALWKEIGLLGAEARTAGPVLVNSCPAPLSLSGSGGLWVRSLLAGTDTIVLICVNDQYTNDPQGCHYTPLSAASVTLTLPAWISSPSVFEISSAGTRDVVSQLSGSSLQMSLGAVNLTRMLVVTTNAALRSTLQQRYDQLFRTKVCNLSPPICAQTPPTISQHPGAQSTSLLGNASFAVQAQGTAPLTYRWQRNQADLSEAPPFSGVTTATLTITGTRSIDAGEYRCVVTNTAGSAVSNPAVLDVLSPDFDHDGDVDLSDFAHLQTCFGTEGVVNVPACRDANLNGDSRVSEDDLPAFLKCMSGAGVPMSLQCMN